MFKREKIKNFNIGKVEAEAEKQDNRFADWFIDPFNLRQKINEGLFIISGRKGSGKSMFAHHLLVESERDEELFVKVLDLEDVKVINAISNRTKDFISNVSLFKWFCLVNITKMIVESQGASQSTGYKKLKQFLETNSRVVDITKYSPIEIANEFEKGLKFKALEQGFSFISKYFSKHTRAPISELLPALDDVVTEVLKYQDQQRFKYFLFLDDLDYDLTKEQSEKIDFLQDMVTTVKSLKSKTFYNTNANVIILLRNDIKRLMIGGPKNLFKTFKASSINLNWYLHQSENYLETPLFKFINKRFRSQNFSNKDYCEEDDVIESIFDVTKTNVFQEIIKLTCYRPRDLIMFFSKWNGKDINLKCDSREYNLLVKQYVKDYFGELLDELSLLFSEIDNSKIKYFLREIYTECKGGSYLLSYDELSNLSIPVSYSELENFIKSLINYNVISPHFKSFEITFQEDDPAEHIDLNDVKYNLHPAVYKYFQQLSN